MPRKTNQDQKTTVKKKKNSSRSSASANVPQLESVGQSLRSGPVDEIRLQEFFLQVSLNQTLNRFCSTFPPLRSLRAEKGLVVRSHVDVSALYPKVSEIKIRTCFQTLAAKPHSHRAGR